MRFSLRSPHVQNETGGHRRAWGTQGQGWARWHGRHGSVPLRNTSDRKGPGWFGPTTFDIRRPSPPSSAPTLGLKVSNPLPSVGSTPLSTATGMRCEDSQVCIWLHGNLSDQGSVCPQRILKDKRLYFLIQIVCTFQSPVEQSSNVSW